MPVPFPKPQATPDNVKPFIEEQVFPAALRYEDGLISTATQWQTTNGTVFC